MKFSKGFYFTFFASLSWAISIVLTRYILREGETALNLVFWTMLFALPFWSFTLLKKSGEQRSLKKKDYLILLSMGIISGIGVTVTESFAIKYSLAMNYSFLIRTVILFTFLFSFLFLKEKITLKKMILAVLILLGSFFLTTQGRKLVFSLGDVLTLLEAALIAFGNNVLGKIATNRMSPDISASFTFLIGFFPMIIFCLLTNTIIFPALFFYVVMLTIINISITLLRFRAYKHATPSYVTMVFSFTPVFVSFMAIPFLNETLTPIQFLGGFLIVIAGIFVGKIKE